MNRRLALLATALFAVCGGHASAADNPKSIVVFGAASLTDALTEVGAAFTKETGIAIKPSFAASSALARQIEAGAPAEVFFPADEEWMDFLEKKQLLAPGSRRDVLANQLVLVARTTSTARVNITTGPQLVSAIGDARVATGDPDSVPVGKYAKAALTQLGAWEPIQPRLIPAENVRAALAYVARSEAAFGIVYLTDARIEKNVKLLATFPASSHPPIRYPIALTAKASPEAKRFTQFVSGKRATTIFEKYGFSVAQ